MSETINSTITQDEHIFKDLIWIPLLEALLGYFSFLNIPIIGTAIKSIIYIISDFVFGKFVMLIDVTTIKLLNTEHSQAYTNASFKLKIIAYDHGIDSQEYEEARDASKIALSNFVRFNQ